MSKIEYAIRVPSTAGMTTEYVWAAETEVSFNGDLTLYTRVGGQRITNAVYAAGQWTRVRVHS